MTEPKRLSAERLAEIAARHAKASPGVWLARILGTCDEVRINAGNVIASWMGFDGADGTRKQKQANVRFIAHAHQDVPALLGHIAACEAELANAKLTAQQELAIRWLTLEREGHGRTAMDELCDTLNSAIETMASEKNALKDHIAAMRPVVEAAVELNAAWNVDEYIGSDERRERAEQAIIDAVDVLEKAREVGK